MSSEQCPNEEYKCTIRNFTSFLTNSYFRLKEHLPKALSDNLTLAETFVLSAKQEFDIQAEEQMNRLVDATEKIVDRVLPISEEEKKKEEEEVNSQSSHERLYRLRTLVTDRIKHLAIKTIEDIKSQENVKRATEYANQFKSSIQEFMNPFDEFNHQFIEKLNVTCKVASDMYRKFFVDPIRHLVIYYSTLIDELARKSSFHEYYILLKEEEGTMKLKVIKVSNKIGEDLKNKMQPYYEHYGNLISEFLKIFIDEHGKFTLKEFESLSKQKIEEFKEQYTLEVLEQLVMEKYNQTKDQFPFIPEQEQLSKYYKDILELFTDENGKFTIDKIQQKIGQTANDSILKATHLLIESKDHVIQNSIESQTITQKILIFFYGCFMIYCYIMIFIFAFICYGFSLIGGFLTNKQEQQVEDEKKEDEEEEEKKEEKVVEEKKEEKVVEEKEEEDKKEEEKIEEEEH